MLTTLHLELTSRCVLKCPACPRTYFSDTFNRPVPKSDLDLNLLTQFLNCSSAEKISKFHLESNHGDVIYSPVFLDFLQTWRSTKNFSIVTNGSRMKPEFWKKLASILTVNDHVTFSIDGLEDTNPMYRVNSDWTSLMAGIDTIINAGIPVTWKTIVFSHNQHQLADIESFALSKGVTEFKLVKSNRFGNDELIPDVSYVAVDQLYQTSTKKSQIDPKCKNGQQFYIDASGYCWPCCWISSYFTLHKTDLWKQRSQWHIKDKTLDQLLDSVHEYAGNIEKNTESAHSVCKMMCG